jgi:hypothetical protein
MAGTLKGILERFGEIIASELVDTVEKSEKAGRLFREAGIDILIVFPFGYPTSMMIVPEVGMVDVTVRIQNGPEVPRDDQTTGESAVALAGGSDTRPDPSHRVG